MKKNVTDSDQEVMPFLVGLPLTIPYPDESRGYRPTPWSCSSPGGRSSA